MKVKAGAISRNYFNMPLWVALHQRLFAQQGLDVSLELHEPIDAVTERLRSGELDIILGVTEHVILDNEADGDMKIVGGNINRLPFSLIAARHIRTFDDLRGGTIGVSSIKAGSSSLIMKIMAEHGLEYPRDYTLKAVGPILARWQMLQEGHIDAGLQGAPLNYVALDQGFHTLCEPRDQFPWFQFTSLHVRSGWAATNHTAMVAFLRAYRQAHEWYFTHPGDARRIAMEECRIDGSYADRAWQEYTSQEIFPRDGTANPLSIQALIDTSALIRALPKRRGTSAEHYMDSAYIEEAAQS